MSEAKSGLLGLAAVLSLAVSQPASGQESESFALSWQGPAGCPSHDDVYLEIARLLGGDIRPKDGPLKAHGLVTHDQTWAVTIETEWGGRTGRRLIEAASCQELANATALIIALMIDPNAVAAHATAPHPAAAPPATVDTSAPKKESPAIDVLFGIHAAFSQGTLPSLDVGPGAGLGLAGKYWRLELRGSYGLRRDQQVAVSTPPGAHGQFNFLAGTLVGCFNLGGAGPSYGPCADVELGVVSAKGVGVDVSLPAHTLWWALGGGLFASLPLGHHLSLPLHADVLVPLRRPEFVFKDDAGRVTSRVFQAAPAGVRISAGVELSF